MGNSMLKNYFLVAFRYLAKYKVYTFINISGFSIALVPVILTFLYASYEFSYDKFIKNYDRIYRVVSEDQIDGKTYFSHMTPGPLAETMKAEFPQIECAVRTSQGSDIVYRGNDKFEEKNILFADPEILNMFSFAMLKGSSAAPLTDPFSVVLSESMAKKYFGSVNPVGKTIRMKQMYEMTVRGVFKDRPENSSMDPGFIIPISNIAGEKSLIAQNATAWGFWRYTTYFMVKPGSDPASILEKFPVFFKNHSNFSSLPDFIFQPLADIHFQSTLFKNPFVQSRELSASAKIYLYLIIAFIILIIAVINYVNLSTAHATVRTKEIGVRKIIGAGRMELIKQLLSESVAVTSCSFIFALLLVYFLLPYFNQYAERDIHMNMLLSPATILIMIGFVLAIGLTAGLHHAVILSSAKPLAIFNGTGSVSRGSRFRDVLVTVQFILAIIIIFAAITVKKQLDYNSGKDLGYNKENILILPLRGKINQTNAEIIKHSIMQNPAVLSAAMSDALPNGIGGGGYLDWPGKPEGLDIKVENYNVDYDFFDLYGLKMTEGRKFSKEFTSDENGSVIMNETAVKMLGFKNPIGQIIIHVTPFGRSSRKVIGIMKDFNKSLHEPITPLYLTIDPLMPLWNLSIKIRAGSEAEILQYLKSVMNKYQPDYPFEYKFFSSEIRSVYEQEYKMQKLFSVLSIFTVMIACLGLVGLVAFATEVRKKEIGIRKVLGAGTAVITLMFSKRYARWVLIADIIAMPVAYYLVNQWLGTYAYRITIGFWIFFLPGFIAFFLAMVTVSFQSVRAALANPVESLRYE